MQFYDLAQTSLAHSGSSVVEEYIPLWFSDGTTFSNNSATTYSTFVQDGSTGGYTTPTAGQPGSLITLNSNWNASQQFSLEATFYTTSPSTGYVSLRDLTSGINIVSAQISTASTTAMVIRSGKFTLTAGHTYGVCTWAGTSGYTVNLVDASLIAFT